MNRVGLACRACHCPAEFQAGRCQTQERTVDLAKVNKSTKDFFGKSKEVLMPWTKSSKKPATHSSSSKKSAPKKSFLTSWMSPKKEEKKPQTVTDFLKQDRPEF